MNSVSRKYCWWVLLIILIAFAVQLQAKDIVRPEKVTSMRKVIYNVETYRQLASQWKQYYKEFKSEDAYANWMYAKKYCRSDDYQKLLKKGLKKYPANPTLLYLSAMIRHGAIDNIDAIAKLERAVKLDPTFVDPWYGLVINYMMQDEPELVDHALRKMLETGDISETVLDYSYNMLSSLRENAILITNGDNDTYPGWVLTRVLKYRCDVTIINRPLLNTEWYPPYLTKYGVTGLMGSDQLTTFRQSIDNAIKSGQMQLPSTGPYADTLIVHIIDAARTAGRPIYFAATLSNTEILKPFLEGGLSLGLVTRISVYESDYPDEFAFATDQWLNHFRTMGLDGWSLRFADLQDASLKLSTNYSLGIMSLVSGDAQYHPDLVPELFKWYKSHTMDLLPPEWQQHSNQLWCKLTSFPEIRKWCEENGFLNE
ncbi:hypothetical protein ACFLQV_02650 [Calditrichota bacterium]